MAPTPAETALTLPPPAVDAPIVLRARPYDVVSDHTYCSACWEPIVHDGEMWHHVRTGLPAGWRDRQCAPLCDWPDCDAPADPTRALGQQIWSGSRLEFQNHHFLCAAHWTAHGARHVTISHIR